ncbi:F0F1 ATP synthase subunit B [Hymenobacter latericus]|uniref:F0F1 ATP synthase subunit B n=1 Tax=Hymenobacter sp. YIM 151858-1 TaxID=2987688 RepID=UPI0022279800|nr:F0F1 ATP synthase subunit B [Hymenobacter sp. YIM 151858-1]UYZ58651.1 F0F1 ATP synthase subunit B [Hymenobacter sp. YIM 151858-1]
MNLITPDLGLLFWQFVVFLLLVFLLAKFAWKPILAGLREREESIENALRQADQAKLEMQQLKAGNEKLLAEARQERDRILKEAATISEQLIEQAKQKATDEGARMIMQAREAIQNEKQAALAEVKNTAAQLSIDIAERILRRELTDSTAQKQLVTDYLQEVKLN